MSEREPPKFEDAPGHVLRPRKDHWVVYWQCRSDKAAQGFTPVSFPLWRGVKPTDEDRAMIADCCQRLQAEMIAYRPDGQESSLPIPKVSLFDGSVRSLIHCYKHDELSPYRKLRYQSRRTYDYFLKYIDQDHGSVRITDIRARDIREWHLRWLPRGVTMAHDLIGMFRGLLTFGATIIEDDACALLKAKVSGLRFEQGQAREAILTAAMVEAIIAKAHERELHSMALAQAIQFEGMLRQKDIIGEWVPLDEPVPSDIVRPGPAGKGMKWIRGIRWNEIDANLVLRHVTSKRQKKIEFRLLEAPMIVAELRRAYPGCITEREVVDPVTEEVTIILEPHREVLPSSGPVIVSETTERPYTPMAFRHIWRGLADGCGIAKDVQQRDSRAGAITEATDAGADLESVRHAATHSDIKMTMRYSRNPAEKTAKVHRLRVVHRNKTGT